MVVISWFYCFTLKPHCVVCFAAVVLKERFINIVILYKDKVLSVIFYFVKAT